MDHSFLLALGGSFFALGIILYSIRTRIFVYFPGKKMPVTKWYEAIFIFIGQTLFMIGLFS